MTKSKKPTLIDPLHEEAPTAAPGKPRRGRKAPAARVVAEAAQGPSTGLLEAPVATPKDPLKADFRKFLFVVLKWVLGVTPTPLQYDIAHYLQTGPRRTLIMAFRGASKSWITAIFALWVLYCNPQRKVLVVSASTVRAAQMTNFCLQIINGMDLLAHLRPKPNQRQSGIAFDVGTAKPDQSPSFRAAGITGQITGSRADVIVPDDVETPQNAATVLMREKLAEAIKEFDAILKPGGKIIFLGTFQTGASIYMRLPSRGYSSRIWPAEYPSAKQIAAYGPSLAPSIREAVRRDPKLEGHSTEPTRFSDDDLASRRLSWGRSGYALQFMLDTALMDVGRHPLKLRDLIVMPLDRDRAPETVSWGNDESLVVRDLPSFGLDGDMVHRPASVAEQTAPYTEKVASIDPSGRGADMSGLAILGELHARLFLLKVKGFLDGYSPATLAAMASTIVEFRCGTVRIEDNFGDGMFTALFKPYLEQAWKRAKEGYKRAGKPLPPDFPDGCDIVPVKAKQTQKELRILSVMEPITQQHRLVVSSEVLREDYEAVMKMDGSDHRDTYSLTYQLTHLTRDRDSLPHDDLLEAVAIGVGHWEEMLGVAPEELAKLAQGERLDEEWERLFGDDEEQGGPRKGAVGANGGWLRGRLVGRPSGRA